jgi:hypothetical protein
MITRAEIPEEFSNAVAKVEPKPVTHKAAPVLKKEPVLRHTDAKVSITCGCHQHYTDIMGAVLHSQETGHKLNGSISVG